MEPEALGAITRILRESKSVEEAGVKIESYIGRNADEDYTARFYDGYFDKTVEEVINEHT